MKVMPDQITGAHRSAFIEDLKKLEWDYIQHYEDYIDFDAFVLPYEIDGNDDPLYRLAASARPGVRSYVTTTEDPAFCCYLEPDEVKYILGEEAFRKQEEWAIKLAEEE
jgi:hypothetical protein